jgi:3-oxoacyl-[acyl-carrier-protein] synthase-3
MIIKIENISISGISSCVPKNLFDFKSFEAEISSQEIQRIIKSTGIHKVRIADSNTKASDLCFAAGEKLLFDLHIDKNSIDAIVFVSQTPNSLMPATSIQLQQRFKLKNDIVAFDISYGCSGYIYGLFQASLLLQSGSCSRVLLCVGDVISPFLKKDDKSVRMIFGDAGSTTLIEKGNSSIYFSIKSDGSGMDKITSKNYEIIKNNEESYAPFRSHFISMDGAGIMEFALKEIPKMIEDLLIEFKLSKSEIDIFALHQANLFMLNYLRKKLGVSPNSVPIYLEDVGNTGPASIPLMLSELGIQLRGKKTLQKSILCGFGVGLSWGSCICDLSKTHFIKKIEF